jgi:hypothetical protein
LYSSSFTSSDWILSIHFDVPPVAANNSLANLRRLLSLFVQLFGKENLLDADQSTGAMVVSVAVQQPAVPELVAIAVARLLGQHFRDLSRRSIRSGYASIIE